MTERYSTLVKETNIMILIAGATGTLGYEICRLLAEGGKEIRSLVRETSDAEKTGKLKSLGAKITYGDLKNRASLAAACVGVNTVISTVSSTLARQEGDSIESVDRQGQLNLIEAAKSAGVSHFIYISFPDTGLSFPLEDAKRSAEDALKGSGMTYTILQPTDFMEVWLSPALGFDPANARATIYGTGENKLSWISYRDVAKFSAASVDNPAVRDETIKLGGPEALSHLEVVSVFENVMEKTFTVEHVPEESLREQMASATDALQKSFAGLMLATAGGNIIDMDRTARDFQIELTSVEDYARSA